MTKTCKCDCNPICLCECHEAEQCRKDHYSGISEWKNEGIRKEYFKFFEERIREEEAVKRVKEVQRMYDSGVDKSLKETMRLLALEIKYAKKYKQPTGGLRDFYDKLEITLNS